MSEELKFKLWTEYPELREELFGDDSTRELSKSEDKEKEEEVF